MIIPYGDLVRKVVVVWNNYERFGECLNWNKMMFNS